MGQSFLTGFILNWMRHSDRIPSVFGKDNQDQVVVVVVVVKFELQKYVFCHV